MQAIWRGVVVAESDDVVLFEGEHYFPAESLKREFTLSSNRRSTCSVKGPATYLSLFVDGDANPDVVCSYAEPSEAAAAIRGRVVFGRGVQIAE
jgi:uncharacterized protein (DUF427 family)